MKNYRPFQSLVVALMTTAIMFSAPYVHGQSNETYDGGTGLWDTDPTNLDWNGSNAWLDNNNAYFNGPADTVTISGTVAPNYLQFNGGTTISGGTIAFTQIPYTHGDPAYIFDLSSEAVAIDSAIELGEMGGNQQTYWGNYGGSTLTLNNIDFGAYVNFDGTPGDATTPGTRAGRVNLQASANSTITLNGDYTTSGGTGGSIIFNSGTGTYDITSAANFSNFNGGLTAFDFEGGVLNVANSTFTSAQTINYYGPSTNLFNIEGAQTIKLSIYSSEKNQGPQTQDGPDDNPYTIGTTGYMAFKQGTADLSTWTGSSNQNGSSTVLEAVAGGRLVWSGNLGSSTPLGLTIGSSTDTTETGTVVLASTSGNSYNESDGDGYIQPGSTTAADLLSGTTLITNTSGSAFGSATTTAGKPVTQGSTTNTEVVKLEGGATLGGTGISAPQIVAESATSVIAPGDPGYHSATADIAKSMGTLHLDGGISAVSGLTMDFKLDGSGNSDLIDLGSGAFTLGGIVTINITSMGGGLETGDPYVLASGASTAAWTELGTPDFVFNTPAAYKVSSYTFGADPENESLNALTVTFEDAPEPSTYALMLGGLALLGVWNARRRMA